VVVHACYLSYLGNINRRIIVQASQGIKQYSIRETPKAISSIPSTVKKQDKTNNNNKILRGSITVLEYRQV
jgi:hypothetical protein